MHPHPLILLLVAGCDRVAVTFSAPDTGGGSIPGVLDQDGDGVLADQDCDDVNPTLGRRRTEVWNGYDDDCDDEPDDLDIAELARAVVAGPSPDLRVGDSESVAVGGSGWGSAGPALVLLTAPAPGVAWILDGDLSPGEDPLGAIGTPRLLGESDRPYGGIGDALGDVTGDGTADLVLTGGATQRATERVWLVLGDHDWTGPLAVDAAAALVVDGDAVGSLAGSAITHDLDGDGLADIIVGAPLDAHRHLNASSEAEAGAVAILDGAGILERCPDASCLVSDAADRIYGRSAGDQLGGSLKAADLDGDGYAEVIAGAPGRRARDSGTGAVYIFAGNRALLWPGEDAAVAVTTISGFASGAVGTIPAVVADFDADGTEDIAVTAPGETTRVWRAVSQRGGALPESDLALAHGDDGDGCGVAVVAGDVDADGAVDLLLGCPGDDRRGEDAGAVRVYRSAETRVATFYGDRPGDRLGSSLSAIFLLDDRPSVFLGSPGSDRGATDGGAVWLVTKDP